MAMNPYDDAKHLSELMWETEMVSDKYSNGGLILIRTKDGWRAFLGNLMSEALREIEKSLDKNVPSPEKIALRTEISRMPTLIKELERLLPDCMCFENYYPEKFIDEQQENNSK